MLFLPLNSSSHVAELVESAINLPPRFLALPVIHLRSCTRHSPAGPVRYRHYHFQIVQQLGNGFGMRGRLDLLPPFQKQPWLFPNALPGPSPPPSPGSTQLAPSPG